jgi:hypothetical protein
LATRNTEGAYIMELATENLVFQGLNDGERVDFSGVKTIEQLKKTIIQNYVPLCRKCSAASFCKFHSPVEPPCPILEKVVSNYVDMNIKSIHADVRYNLEEFIKSIVLLLRIFMNFENWRGLYVDEYFNWYFESVHPTLNSTFVHELLIDIGKFVRSYRVVNVDRLKKFVILVEGNSEFLALPPILDKLGVLGINFDIKNSVRFVNLEGKDRAQRDKIRDVLARFGEEETTYFLIIDNDPEAQTYIDDLKREGLLQDGHYLVWTNKFEDNFGEEAIVKVIGEVTSGISDKIDVAELKELNSAKNDIVKSVEHLLRKREIEFKFDDYKVKIAQRLSQWVCKEIDESMSTTFGVHDGSRTPASKSFPIFAEKLRKIAEEINRISSEFHVVKA